MLVTRVPENLPAPTVRADRRVPAGGRFRTRLRAAIRATLIADRVLAGAGAVARLGR
ncbi:hypothetical protein J8F10_16535 [Gemmata sp. G18]|uniref:Uncharacterized protein n=1 Tax=Gemmata palustris TaxID=2822762 RepID=A0ABS5BT85_9BACT|nr:hypothetical protein [Gemmata palustris]MBP3956880.1 hypothetical protein [Gemmata palustris]